VTAGGSSTLSVNAGTAAAGTYILTVTGTEGSATHSATVSLTVTDSDVTHLQDTATTTAEILDYIEATIVPSPSSGNVIRTAGNSVQKFGLWMLLRPVTDIDPSTIRMSTTFPNAGTVPDIKIAAKATKLGDLDGNGFRELDFAFRTSDVRALLAHVTNGRTITILITARAISDGARFRGALDMVKQGAATVASAAAPNPFNPETSISYSVETGGTVSIRIFSVTGRLVRALFEEPATAGAHQVRWNGQDDDGRPVPSGTYFVRVEQNGASSHSKLSVLR